VLQNIGGDVEFNETALTDLSGTVLSHRTHDHILPPPQQTLELVRNDIEQLVRLRCALFSLPYGDQGLLMSRAFYQRLGGFHLMPLMEDVDLVRRIGRANLVSLDADVVASARRYERDGWVLRPLRNLSCLALFSAGVPVSVVRRLYDG